MSESGDSGNCTPPDILKAASNMTVNLLPTKSRSNYIKCYHEFMEWKPRMMNYLQKSLIWDNTYVQTTILVYRETGSLTKPRSNKPQLKHINVGPSMFPFLYYPSKNLVGKSTNVSQPSSGTFSHSSRNDRKNETYRMKQPNVNSQYSRIQSRSDEVTDNILTPAKDKMTSTMIHLSSIKLANSEPQDTYTQMLVTCNNAATNIKFTPTTVGVVTTNNSTITVKSTHEAFYNGIDKGSDPITMNVPQRSISVMTSKGIVQEPVHKETQVSLEPSIRKVSTAVMAQEEYKYAKSSVVTDSTVPCRRLENILITPKGTILSCTGSVPISTHPYNLSNLQQYSTKITSVSSVHIQTASVTSRISKMKNSVATAISTNFVTTKNTDCFTAPSLYRSHVEDISLGTDGCQIFRSEKSTSCPVLKNYANAGVSVFNVVDHESFNGGSHHTQASFCAGIHPEYSPISMDTSRRIKSKSAGTGTSFEKQPKNDSKIVKNYCNSQYNDIVSRKSNDASENSRCQARIGRSRLMSVRMLGDSFTEMATQAQPIFNSTETNTAFKQASESIFTSQYTFNMPLQACTKIEEDTGRTLTCHCAHMGSDNEAIDAKGHKSQSPASPALNEISCKTNEELKSLSHLMIRNGTQPKQEANAKPNFVISSNLNAAKWIKGCAKDSDKDVQSIINLSETMVTESLDRASLVIAKSQDKSISEMKKLSKFVINQQPAISCATAKAYNANPSVSIAKILPTKDNCLTQGSPSVPSKQNYSNVLVNKQASDGTVTKDMKESIPQIGPNLRDAETDAEVIPFRKKSASILTSRHILPRPSTCKNVCKNNTDCLFVYGRPRCVVHNYRVDARIQTKSPQDSDVNRIKEICFKRKVSTSNRSIGLMTSLAGHLSCHQKSGMIGEVLSPKVYKALYETTKLMSRKGSDSRTTKNSTIETASNKTENEDSLAESRIPNRKMSQMTSCMLFTPSHCFCARCLEAESRKHQSIQAVGNQAQSFLYCPQCCARVTELSHDRDRDSTEDCLKSQLASSCRYYSNLLTVKLGQVKDNFKRHLASPIEETLYKTPTIPNIIFTEACTMKPSGRQDENCQAKLLPQKIDRPSCVLFPALSLTDIRGRDKHDLKTVYYILTAIEGRVRRLKNNLHT